MHARSFRQPRSRSACCPPGCRLPCCAPRRRRACKTNRCIFIPAPALTTKRYCGDPCSPPPPACLPKPIYGRRRPLSSPRPYSRPFRPYSSLYSSTNPCRPKKCGPLDPCVPSLTDRCDPCMPRSICDPCLPSSTRFSSPCRFKGNKSRSCRPRRTRCSPSPKCRATRSSSYGSSYCESACSRRAGSKRCQTCECDPCCCKKSSVKNRPNEDTAKGPTSWFLKQSEKCGKAKSSKDPHYCPWEAEVTVTGTVRGHCTSTAVEVAKRLTGKFSSKGQRYTCKKKGSKCDTKKETKNQRMALGYLDDGTKLDFSRNRCEDEDEDVYNRQSYVKGRTNNAKIESSVSDNRWRSKKDDIKVKERKSSDRSDLHFATAYIGRKRNEAKGGSQNIEERQHDDMYTFGQREYSKGPEPEYYHSRHSYNRHRNNRHWVYAASSDSDQSSYKTASESMQCSRRYPSLTREDENIIYARRKGRRKNPDPYTNKSRFHNERREAWWRQHHNHPTSLDDHCYYSGEEDEDDVITFNLVSEEDSDNINSEGVSDRDDIDKDHSHFTPSPAPRRLAMDRQHARSSDRRSLSPVSYTRRSTHSRPQPRHRRTTKVSGAAQHRPDSAYLDLDASSGQSSEGELGEGSTSNTVHFKPRETQQKRDTTHQQRRLPHRKRVSYSEGL
ncbi:hypothetical protein ElyMa_002555800 [Elysia marginata]|uniref:Uncharacterized protein n=1 Tax=Elysia marginata TaxID=1093978 RepID=A0AAV4GVQ3_9GAST|nr:hypothetical protein ElyMa_002555800 [Elysia marginata]